DMIERRDGRPSRRSIMSRRGACPSGSVSRMTAEVAAGMLARGPYRLYVACDNGRMKRAANP
ncbi:hypothetical protein V7F95_10905, partial [Cutibacterium avidum]|uniref:hypothetical protein n=1 Tax=Cutibacterium avidum TaxID=33010 RepID=UPI002FF21BF2